MSFVMGESKRELDFFNGSRMSAGPNLGPGSYGQSEEKKPAPPSKIPFMSGERRRIDDPSRELLRDCIQFRIINAERP